MNYKKVEPRFVRHIASIPFIYFQIIPFLFLDFSMEMYHRIGFWLYKLPYVKRSQYIRIDRHKIKYLSPVEKLHCMYCGYINGLLAYGVEIAGRTEHYWCGIKHQKDPEFQEPAHHRDFIEYDEKIKK